MAQESHKGKEAQELIKQFTGLKRSVSLKQWEKLHRDQLQKAPFEVKDAFDRHWTAVTGASYWTPVTDIPVPQLSSHELPGRIDPKSRAYLTQRTFTSIRWKKHVYTTGKGLEKETHYRYELSGDHSHGNTRFIAKKCKPERIVDYLGTGLSDQILEAGKTDDQGEITGLNHPVSIEGHWEVRFSGKASKDDNEWVELQHEGRCLQIMRNEPVILPGGFVEVNDNATHSVFVQTPEQPRKIIGTIQHFPCTVLREATEREFRAQKEEGDRITRAQRKMEESA
jgi:hypothetical protein